jgi:hypothetical protein
MADVSSSIESLTRGSRRFQEQLESLRRGSRRFQEEMDAARRELRLPSSSITREIESLKRGSLRFQELLEAPRRAARRFHADIEALRHPQNEFEAFQRVLQETQAALAAEIRLWRTDPHLILLNPRSTLKQRRAAARRIAATQVIAFKRPAVRKALSEWRRQPAERDTWLRQLFADALVDAGKEASTPLPRIRLGRRWVKGWVKRRGKDHREHTALVVLEHVAPMELIPSQARRWLLQRAWRLMELAILGDDVASGRYRRRLSRRDREALGEDQRGVEAMLEYHPTPPATLRKRRLSKRERQLYDLLRAGVSSTEAAVRLKLSPSTVRVLTHRLRAKGWLKM